MAVIKANAKRDDGSAAYVWNPKKIYVDVYKEREFGFYMYAFGRGFYLK